MGLSDWLLFLHVLSAFALVGALVVYWALVLATRPAAPVLSQATSARIVAPTNLLVIAGTLGVVVFGVWLAIDHESYSVWDGWIVASLVLWAVYGVLGDRSGKAFARAMAPEHAGARRRGLILHSAASVVVLVILVLMIWKPGA